MRTRNELATCRSLTRHRSRRSVARASGHRRRFSNASAMVKGRHRIGERHLGLTKRSNFQEHGGGRRVYGMALDRQPSGQPVCFKAIFRPDDVYFVRITCPRERASDPAVFRQHHPPAVARSVGLPLRDPALFNLDLPESSESHSRQDQPGYLTTP